MNALFARIQYLWLRFAPVKNKSNLSFSVRMAAFFFASQRSEYYSYIADMITSTGGKKKLRQIFRDDAINYGRSNRGILSGYWADMFDKHGGKFGKVFAGTLPDEEVMLLRLIQMKGGNDILPEGLRDLAANTAVVKKAIDAVLVAVVGFIVPFSLMVGMFIGVPLFSVPELKDIFSDLPPELYPASAKQLFAISAFLENNVFTILIVAAAMIGAIIYSLPRLRGRVRFFCDKYLYIWAIYRDFEAVKFMSSLALVIKTRNSKSDRLKESLDNLVYGASPWKADMINRMSDNLMNKGVELRYVFRVGLFDKRMQHELEDLIQAKTLNGALEYLRPRLEERLISKLRKRCKALMWMMIVISIASIIYMFFLHSQATQELTQAMSRFYTN